MACEDPYTHDHEGEAERHDLSCSETPTHAERDSETTNERITIAVVTIFQSHHHSVVVS